MGGATSPGGGAEKFWIAREGGWAKMFDASWRGGAKILDVSRRGKNFNLYLFFQLTQIQCFQVFLWILGLFLNSKGGDSSFLSWGGSEDIGQVVKGGGAKNLGHLLCSHWTEGQWLALQRKENSTTTYDASNNGLKRRPEMILFQLRYSLGFPIRSG